MVATLEHEPATLPTIHLGAPSYVGPLTLFPVWTDAPIPRTPTKLGIAAGAAIAELDEGPTVETLKVANPTATSFALLEGTVVDGGWQHRVLIHDVLVAAATDLLIPVRCVEQGRWRGATRQKVSRRRAPLAVSGAVRGLKEAHLADRSRPADRANQGEIWATVASYEHAVGAATATGSLVDMFDQVDVTDVRAAAPKPLAGQRGVLVGIDGHPALLELFEHPRSLTQQWNALLDGLLGSTAHLRPVPTSGRRARAFVQRLSGRHLPTVDAVGAGRLAEAHDDLVSVRSLTDAAGGLVHTAALNVRHRLVLAA